MDKGSPKEQIYSLTAPRSQKFCLSVKSGFYVF